MKYWPSFNCCVIMKLAVTRRSPLVRQDSVRESGIYEWLLPESNQISDLWRKRSQSESSQDSAIRDHSPGLVSQQRLYRVPMGFTLNDLERLKVKVTIVWFEIAWKRWQIRGWTPGGLFESSHGLSIGTVRFDLEGLKTKITVFGVKYQNEFLFVCLFICSLGPTS